MEAALEESRRKFEEMSSRAEIPTVKDGMDEVEAMLHSDSSESDGNTRVVHVAEDTRRPDEEEGNGGRN